MAANLDRPKIIVPTECPDGAFVAGTGSDILVHTCVSGNDEMDAVTVEAGGTGGVNATVKVPNTAGGQSSIVYAVPGNSELVAIIDRALMNNGAEVYVNATSAVVFKVSVERYPVGKNEPQAPR